MVRASTDIVRRSFETLEECLDFVTRGRAPGASGGAGLPPFLFRGEPGGYGSTLPGIVRVLRSGRTPAVTDLLIDLEGDLLWEFEDEFGQSTLGFAQHYGFPTDYVEFTASPRVAACFAAGPGGRGRGPGLIGVLDVPAAARYCEILDLSRHPRASRPARQRAYAVRPQGGNLQDFKAPLARTRLGMTWYGFERHDTDLAAFPDPESVTDPRDDVLAAWMRGRIRWYRSRPSAALPEVERLLGAMEQRASRDGSASRVAVPPVRAPVPVAAPALP